MDFFEIFPNGIEVFPFVLAYLPGKLHFCIYASGFLLKIADLLFRA